MLPVNSFPYKCGLKEAELWNLCMETKQMCYIYLGIAI
jgi:hypothetical protein